MQFSFFNLTAMRNEFGGNRLANRTQHGLLSKSGTKTYQKPYSTMSSTTHNALEKENIKYSPSEEDTRSQLHNNSHSKLSSKQPKFILTDKKPQRDLQGRKFPFDTSYSRDYITYLRRKEVDSMIGQDYLKSQREIDSSVRLVLIDWMLDMQKTLKFSLNTLFLSVLIVDRFLAHEQCKQDEFYLLGITSILIASKCEDLKAAAISRDVLLNISENTITSNQLSDFEAYVLKSNYFRMGYVTLHTYLEKLSPVFTSEKNKQILHMLGILTLFQCQIASIRMSTIAYCLLEVLQQVSQSPAFDEFLDRNEDFLNAQVYLDIQVLSVEEQKLCFKHLHSLMFLVKVNNFEGLTRMFGHKLELIKLIEQNWLALKYN